MTLPLNNDRGPGILRAQSGHTQMYFPIFIFHQSKALFFIHNTPLKRDRDQTSQHPFISFKFVCWQKVTLSLKGYSITRTPFLPYIQFPNGIALNKNIDELHFNHQRCLVLYRKIKQKHNLFFTDLLCSRNITKMIHFH